MPAATADTARFPPRPRTRSRCLPCRRERRAGAASSRSCSIVVATLLAPLTLAVLWMNHDLLNTDNYVSHGSAAQLQPGRAERRRPEPHRPALGQGQRAAAAVRRAAVVGPGLLGPLSNQLKAYTYQAIHAVVSSKAFAQGLGGRQPAGPHPGLGGAAGQEDRRRQTTASGQVSIDFAPVVDQVKSALDGKGIHVLDPVATTPGSATFVIFRSATLAKAQKTVSFFHKLSVALPLLLLAAWVGAIAVSRRRRRTVLQLGFTLALAMVVTLVAYHLGRGAVPERGQQSPASARRRRADLRRAAGRRAGRGAHRVRRRPGDLARGAAGRSGRLGRVGARGGRRRLPERGHGRRAEGPRPRAGRLVGGPPPPCRCRSRGFSSPPWCWSSGARRASPVSCGSSSVLLVYLAIVEFVGRLTRRRPATPSPTGRRAAAPQLGRAVRIALPSRAAASASSPLS